MPTPHLPRTEGKIAVLAARAKAHLPLFLPGDAGMDQFHVVRAPILNGYGRPASQNQFGTHGWTTLTEREYRQQGHEAHEDYWNQRPWKRDCLEDPGLPAIARAMLKMLARGRWLSVRAIRQALDVAPHRPRDVFRLLEEEGVYVRRRVDNGLGQYRIDPGTDLDAAREIVQDWQKEAANA